MDGRRDGAAAEMQQSLRRLRTDYIDVYYAHHDDTDTPLDETLGAFDSLVTSGKVRCIAASNYEADRLERERDQLRSELARVEGELPERREAAQAAETAAAGIAASRYQSNQPIDRTKFCTT